MQVVRSKESASQIMSGKYFLTGDNLLKMLAIFIRLRVGIPVILMGECGFVFLKFSFNARKKEI